MKKVLIVIGLLMTSSVVFADNTKRIKELEDQIKQLIQKDQEVLAQSQKIREQILRLDGAIQELKNQDTKAKK